MRGHPAQANRTYHDFLLRKPRDRPGVLVAGPADAASLRLASPSEPSRFERPMRVGQAAHACDIRERESDFGPSGLSRLLRSTLVEMRCGDAMPPDGSRPTGSSERGGEILLRVDRPPQDPSDQAGTGRSIIEIGSRSIDRVYTGSTRAPIPIAALSGLSAQPPRKHLPPALFRMKPREASGQDRWQQHPAPGLRQRSKALRPAAASGVGAAVRNRDDDQRSDLQRREGIARR